MKARRQALILELDRPRAAPQPGAAPPPAAPARLRRHAGDDLARHQGARPREARRRRRLSAAGRRHDESRRRRSPRSSARPPSSCAASSACSSSSSSAPGVGPGAAAGRSPSIARSCRRRSAPSAATTRSWSSRATRAAPRRSSSGSEGYGRQHSGKGEEVDGTDRVGIFRRPRYVGGDSVAQGEVQRRDHRRDDGPRAGQGARRGPRPRAGHRRRPRARARPARGVRARLHPAGAQGRRHLRRPLSDGDRARPAAHRAEARRDRRNRAGDRRRPRLHRQGQRPGAPRRDHARAQPEAEGHRAGARLGHDAARRDRIRARQRNVPVPATVASPYSTDSNLWGRSIECGILEDPWPSRPRRSTR